MPKGRRRSGRLSNGGNELMETTDVGDLSQAVYDEVDEFHQQRHNAAMKQAKIRGLNDSDDEADNTREVFGVDVDSDDDDEVDADQLEAGASDKSEDEGESASDDEEDEDEEKYLPSADAWGKKKSTFYSTDYVGDEYGGLSGSDIEEAELEEKEARKLQRRLQENMEEDDLLGDMAVKVQQAKQQASQRHTRQSVLSVPTSSSAAVPDVLQGTDQDKLQWLINNNQELVELIQERNNIVHQLESIRPFIEVLKTVSVPSDDMWTGLQHGAQVLSSYLLLIEFYMSLKASTPLALWTSTKSHPVIDKIIRWKKAVNRAQRVLSHYQPRVMALSSQCQSVDGQLDTQALARLLSPSTTKLRAGKQKSNQKTKSGKKGKQTDELADMFVEEGQEDWDGLDEDERRAIGAKIQKNRGLTPWKHKKKDKHSRVKRRHLYKKALTKKRSQVPDVKREMNRYGGEERGIRSGVVKSVKLK